MVETGGKATCVKADTSGFPSDHMLNYAIFDVVMELVYLLIKKTNISDHIGIYIYVHQDTYSTTPEPVII